MPRIEGAHAARKKRGSTRLPKLLSVKSYSSYSPGDIMKMKKSTASSQPEKLTRRSEADIRAYAKSPAAKKASALLQENIRKQGLEPPAADLREI
jgi:hypothetical protein